MRKVVISVAALLLLGGFAAPAQAKPDYECTEKQFTDGMVQVERNRDCTVDVTVFEGIICVGGWGGVIQEDVRGHTVRVYYCTGQDIPIEPATTQSGPCKPLSTGNAGITVTVSADCHIQVDAKLYDCVWNCGWNTVVDSPVLTVRMYGQQNSGVASATPCPAGELTSATYFEDCTLVVRVPALQACLWRGEWREVVGVPGVVSVQTYQCVDPDT